MTMDEILDELVAKGVSGRTIVVVAKALEELARREKLLREHRVNQHRYQKKQQAAE
jgi:hypothetical protein